MMTLDNVKFKTAMFRKIFNIPGFPKRIGTRNCLGFC